MKLQSLRPSLAKLLLAFGAALLLGSCGGGGGGSSPNLQGGVVVVQPATGTAYAGVPFTFTVTGGRRPYTISSSEPSLLPVPLTINDSTFTTIPANPGVVDANLQPGELPVRTVTITARDSAGAANFNTAVIRVAINFLTGYGIFLSPNNCPTGSIALTSGSACAGGTTAVRFSATTNGNLHGNKPFRVEVVRGNFSLRNPTTGQASSSINVVSDHQGDVIALLEVPLNAVSQVAVIRIVDAATGVYTEHAFVISGSGATNALTIIPNEFSFTGALTTTCGTGSADFLVFDGIPPYTAVSSNVNLQVSPTQSNSQPGRFTLTAGNPGVCMSDATIIVTDSRGARGTVTVDTKAGTQAPTPPPELDVAPASITLACGQSGSVSVVGGVGSYSIASSNPAVSAVISGNTLTISRAGSGAPGAGSMTSSISVTDGRTIDTVTVTSPATCP